MSGTLSWQGIVCKCGSHVCCTIECVTVRSELRVNNCIDYFTGHREVKRLLHHALYILCVVSGILTPYCHYRPWQQRTEGGHSSIPYSQTYSAGTCYRGSSQICLQCITNIHTVCIQFLYTIQAIMLHNVTLVRNVFFFCLFCFFTIFAQMTSEQ